MKPIVGRIVYFHPTADVTHAAIIAYVHSDTMVNLAAFDGNGKAYGQTSVQLVAPGASKPEFGFYCDWMPYQVEAQRAFEPLTCEAVEQVTITLSKTMAGALERVLVRAEKAMLAQG